MDDWTVTFCVHQFPPYVQQTCHSRVDPALRSTRVLARSTASLRLEWRSPKRDPCHRSRSSRNITPELGLCQVLSTYVPPTLRASGPEFPHLPYLRPAGILSGPAQRFLFRSLRANTSCRSRYATRR